MDGEEIEGKAYYRMGLLLSVPFHETGQGFWMWVESKSFRERK